MQRACPFCRDPYAETGEDINKNRMKRIEANDPMAMCEWAKDVYNEGYYEGAFKYWKKAADLGDADAQ